MVDTQTAIKKIYAIIDSCKTQAQLESAKRVYLNYISTYVLPTENDYHIKMISLLEALIRGKYRLITLFKRV